MEKRGPYIVSVQGLKNSGKTTVAEALIASLLGRGYRTGGVKLAGHARLDLDARGTDTFRQAAAGAEFVLARSEAETFLFRRGSSDAAPLLRLVSRDVQFVVCEGCRDKDVDSYVLCLRSPSEIEATLRKRGLTREQVIAFSGAAAAAAAGGISAGQGYGAEARFFDVRRPPEREALADLLVAAAGSPVPAGLPSGPLAPQSSDPGWRPGLSH
jgi:molybdopterin-guanine dinucleotide biosynthesis protein B